MCKLLVVAFPDLGASQGPVVLIHVVIILHTIQRNSFRSINTVDLVYIFKQLSSMLIDVTAVASAYVISIFSLLCLSVSVLLL